MPKRNPAREFIRRYEALIQAEDTLTSSRWLGKGKGYTHQQEDGEYYWPFGYEWECDPDDCFKREDGLWQKKERINKHTQPGGYIVAFLWRTHPNYSAYGKPSCTNKSQESFYEKSETSKTLFSTEDFDFVWAWYEPRRPTDICWASSVGQTYFEVRDKKTQTVLVRASTRTAFIREFSYYNK